MRVYLGILTLSLCSLALVDETRADTIVVAPSGLSLAEAIAVAVDGDIVALEPGVYSASGIRIGGLDITIRGSGTEQTVLDGGNSGPVLTFADAETRSTTVENLTIRNGAAQESFEGGGIFITGASPTIRNVRFLNNQNTVDDEKSGGGALKISEGSDPAVVDCHFEGNVASGDGGAIRLRLASATIENSTFVGNSVTGDIQSGGGAISLSEPVSVQVINSEFTANTAGGGGGAISSFGGPLIVTGSLFDSNRASDFGGAIRVRGGTLTVANSQFQDNIAIGEATSNGGGISVSGLELVTIESSTFERNEAGSVAGAVSLYTSSGSIRDSVFRQNEAAEFGGAIRLEDDRTQTVETFSIERSEFVGNLAGLLGGAIHGFFEVGSSGGSQYAVNDNFFSMNVAENSQCVADGQAECGRGGALQFVRENAGAGTLEVRRNRFVNNRADSHGQAQFNKVDLEFTDNVVDGGVTRFRYAGITCENIGQYPCSIERNRFFNNRAGSASVDTNTKSSGALYLNNVSARVANNFFAANEGSRGSAIVASGSGFSTILHNSFASNITRFAGGASVFLEGDAEISRNVFAGDSRGVRVKSEDLDVVVGSNNFSDQSVALVRVETSELDNVTSLNAASIGTGNTNLSPGFLDSSGGELYLSADSPLVDSVQCNVDTMLDLQQDSRPLGSQCEPGADEYNRARPDGETLFLSDFEMF